jgi:hypothetical protein
MAAQAVSRGVRAIDFEALLGAAVAGHQSDVMKHCAGVEQLAVELEAAVNAGQGSKMVDPGRMRTRISEAEFSFPQCMRV